MEVCGFGGRFLFGLLDLLPVAQHGVGIGGHCIAKDVRMAANELGVQVGGYVLDGEVAGLGGHLGVEEHLQQKIAQLVLQIGPGAALDGVEDLVGLLQRVALDGVEGLFAVPGTAARPSQTRHDRDCFGKRIGGRVVSS